MNYKLPILRCSKNWPKNGLTGHMQTFYRILTQGTFFYQKVHDKLRCPCKLFYNSYQHACKFSGVSIQEELQKWTYSLASSLSIALWIGHARDWCQFGKVKDSSLIVRVDTINYIFWGITCLDSAHAPFKKRAGVYNTRLRGFWTASKFLIQIDSLLH